MSEQKINKKKESGVVVSNKMDRTIVVQIRRLVRHKFYGKYIRRDIKYIADDPDNSCHIGDRVLIEECRPLSKTKRWRLRSIDEKAL